MESNGQRLAERPPRRRPRWPAPTEPVPDEEQIAFWVIDSVCEATDGCTVEPDGVCPHGYPSWLVHLRLI
jgi:hypothetical protein